MFENDTRVMGLEKGMASIRETGVKSMDQSVSATKEMAGILICLCVCVSIVHYKSPQDSRNPKDLVNPLAA